MRRATWLSLVWCVACSPANPAPGDGTDPIETVRLCTSNADCAGDARCENGLCTTEPPHDAGTLVITRDAGRPDAGHVDAGVRDAGFRDAGAPDAGFRDAGTPDSGVVHPPIDISGWRVENREHDPVIQAFVVPDGTQLAPGQHLLLVRGVDRLTFENDVGLDLGVHHFIRTDAQSNGVPIVNGGESWALVDASGTTVDGPTIPGVVAASYRRKDPGDAQDLDHWVVAGELDDVPGSTLMTSSQGVRICQWSDDSSTGRYVFEYVELCYAP